MDDLVNRLRARRGLIALGLGGALALGCGGDDERNGGQLPTTSLTAGSATSGGSDTGEDSISATGMDVDKLDMGGGADSSGDGTTGDECASVSEMANVGLQPADIIIVVDNSGSMQFEAGAVQANMNAFSSQIFLANIDARVILISRDNTSDTGICVAQPLGSGACPLDDNPPGYVHIADSVGSNDALDKILQHYDTYSQYLRPTAAKHILVVSDDNASMESTTFDQMFKALDPSLADYTFHAIASPENEVLACVQMTSCCLLAAALSQEYIELVNLTGGVFGNLCEQDFQPVFTELSQAVISGATLACEYDIPPPPEGEEFDPDKVNVNFDDGQGGTLEIGRVDSPADCPMVVDGRYYDDPANPTSIIVCPQTCDTIQGFAMAAVEIQFGCATVDAPPVG